ncbi:UPF0764 protein C16orf89 homolog isoform X2 [Anabrus simplex]|uniref:UPF0764 protein C16orf89 homolog isoform X2 n=1 Tax=Anabrus simplex TaxID=316456 RepID=UPI0034DCD8DC
MGQLRVLLRHLQQQNTCTVDVTNKEKKILITILSQLEENMKTLLEQKRDAVSKRTDPDFNFLVDKMLIPELWEVDQPLVSGSLPEPSDTRNATMDLMTIVNRLYKGLPDEKVSDFCIGEVLGAKSSPCEVSNMCRNVELEAARSVGYPLTHRLLYVQAARQRGCDTLGSPKEVAAYVKDFCGMILNDAQLTENLDFPLIMIDLFAEQVALCGMEGFKEFTKPSWVKKILSWVRPEGCFGNREEMIRYETKVTSNRYKREDGVMSHGCLMHFTAVGTAALATSLRSMVECSSN